ncbi:MAG: AAA family ATPase [Bacteroidota bacterium]
MKPPTIRFPYGRSNYASLIRRGYHYVDKTRYLEWLEESDESYIFFLRPRRFGKSLFVSMLEYYYDVKQQGAFEELFGKFYIGQNPTPEQGTYWILQFNFSGIHTTNIQLIEEGFLMNVRSGIDYFIHQYLELSKEERQQILTQPQANMMLRRLLDVLKKQPIKPVYLLIDEYDHFTNALIADNVSTFQQVVGQDGFVRTFYETIKNGTGEGTIERIFVTGVSPVTLDSLTSGFNIGSHLSLELDLHEMMGFSEEEVLSMLSQVAPADQQATILADMRQWYNGYLFHAAAKRKVYNSDMVLYFLKHYKRHQNYPEEMLDTNISSDYGKLRRLFNLRTPEQNYEVLQDILRGKVQKANIVAEFSLVKTFSKNDFISLLFYLGFLTIKNTESGFLQLGVPNYVIQRLYFDFFVAQLTEKEEMPTRLSQLQNSIVEMAMEGNPHPFFQEVEHVLQHLSRRDYQRFSEKYVKAIIMALALQVETFFVKSEREHASGYSDLLFLQRPPINIDHQYLFELKYLKQSDKKELADTQQQAKQQLLAYLDGASELQAIPNLQAWTVVVVKDTVYLERGR